MTPAETLQALRRIADSAEECGCTHDDENCCERVGIFCARCIAAAALQGEPSTPPGQEPELTHRMRALATEAANDWHQHNSEADGFGCREGHRGWFHDCAHPDCAMIRGSHTSVAAPSVPGGAALRERIEEFLFNMKNRAATSGSALLRVESDRLAEILASERRSTDGR